MRTDNLKSSGAPQPADIRNSCFPGASLSASSLREQIYSIFNLDEKGVFCIREGADIEGFAAATDIRIPFAAGGPLPGCIPVIALKEKARKRGAGIGLGIAADLRGKGLGLALLRGILRFIMKTGGRKITLFGAVDKINYYGKAGFSTGPVYLVMEK